MSNLKDFFTRHRKPLTIGLCVAIVLSVAVGGAIAWFTDSTEEIKNSFSNADVSCEIKENFDGSTKSDVCVHNTSSMYSYIRVKVVPSWENDKGEAVPVKATLGDLNIVWGNSKADKWIDGGNGYYYYKEKVAPNGNTDILISKATIKTANGNKMNLSIVAEAIQGDPADAVKEAWGRTVGTDGCLS